MSRKPFCKSQPCQFPHEERMLPSILQLPFSGKQIPPLVIKLVQQSTVYIMHERKETVHQIQEIYFLFLNDTQTFMSLQNFYFQTLQN